MAEYLSEDQAKSLGLDDAPPTSGIGGDGYLHPDQAKALGLEDSPKTSADYLKEGEQKPGIMSRLASGAAGDIANIAKGAYNIVRHPLDTASGVLDYIRGGGEAIREATGYPSSGATPEQVERGKAAFKPTKEAIEESIRNPKGIPGRLLESAIEHPISAAMNASILAGAGSKIAEGSGMAGTAKALGTAERVMNPVTAVSEGVKKLPLNSLAERIYGSAAKMPLSKAWLQTLPGREGSARQVAVKAGIENRVPISEYGLQKAKALEQETRSIIDGIIDQGTAQGFTGETQDLLKGLDNAYRQAAASGNPRKAAEIVDKAAEAFLQRPKTITPSDLQAIKRQLYKEVDTYTGEFKSIYDSAEKGLAHEAMSKLEELFPELHNLNQKDAAFIKLREALEKAVGRETNKDVIGLGAKVLSNSSIPMAIWEATIGHPQVKSRLAFALDAAAKSKISPMAYSMKYKALQYAGDEDQ